MNYDEQCLFAIDNHREAIIPWYMMGLFSREEQGDSVLSDKLMEIISDYLMDKLETFNHPHTSALCVDQTTQSVFAVWYPAIVESSLHNLRNQ